MLQISCKIYVKWRLRQIFYVATALPFPQQNLYRIKTSTQVTKINEFRYDALVDS